MDKNRNTAVERAFESFDLLTQLDDERTRRYEELNAACERLNAENETLRRRVADTEAASVEAARKTASAEARLETSRGEIDRLRVEIEARDTRSKRTEKQLGDVQAERDGLKVRLEAKDQELSEVAGRFEALTDAMNERVRLASERVGAATRRQASIARPAPVAAIAPPVLEDDARNETEVFLVGRDDVAESIETGPSAQVLTIAASSIRTVPEPDADIDKLDKELEATFDGWSDDEFASDIEDASPSRDDEQDARAKSLLGNFSGIFGGRNKTASGT